MLAPLAGRPVTVAHLGSASGAFVPALSASGRVVLAATRANETNESRFAGHFIAALDGASGDRNRDGWVSALEAFEFARAEVERDFDREGLLRTEHALLDDNGDGEGSLEPSTAPGDDGTFGDGALAARTHLFAPAAPAETFAGAAGPRLRELIAQRDALAARVDALRAARAGWRRRPTSPNSRPSCSRSPKSPRRSPACGKGAGNRRQALPGSARLCGA